MSTLELSPLEIADIERVLVVVAHPDDAEYGTSAAVAEWVKNGIEVAYLLLTAGEAGMQRSPEEARPLRIKEQEKACETVGVQKLTVLDFADGMLEYGLSLRQAIATEIRAFKPNAVVCGAGELKVPWGFDHPDHRAVGLATIDAVRDAANKWVFPTADLASWSTAQIWLTGTSPTHFFEVSAEAESLAVKSLQAHAEYLADLPWHPAPADFIPPMLAEHGTKAGVARAMTFAAHNL